MIKVLFVCLGNICRSPLAEGIFAEKVGKMALENLISYDSAGTDGYHAGELPDPRSRKVAEMNGFRLTHHSRKLQITDFEKFDYILAMDKNNLRNIQNMQEKVQKKASIFLVRHFDEKVKDHDLEDPYWGDLSDFEKCYHILEPCLDNFLNFLIQKHNIKTT